MLTETKDLKTITVGDKVYDISQLSVPEIALLTGYSQLQSYVRSYHQDGEEPTDHIQRDIKGYEEVINSKCRAENTRNFLSIKHDCIRLGKEYDNLQVVDTLKKTKVWKG